MSDLSDTFYNVGDLIELWHSGRDGAPKSAMYVIVLDDVDAMTFHNTSGYITVCNMSANVTMMSVYYLRTFGVKINRI